MIDNRITETPPGPKTGENSPLIPLAIALGITAVAAVVTLVYKKKVKKAYMLFDNLVVISEK